MVPKSGYWRDNLYSDRFFKCPKSDACIGSPDYPYKISYTGECNVGYTGNLCNQCSSGYHIIANTICEECTDTVTTAFILILVFFAVFVIISFLVR